MKTAALREKQARIEKFIDGNPAKSRQIRNTIGIEIKAAYLEDGRIRSMGPHKHKFFYRPRDERLAYDLLRKELGVAELRPPPIVLEEIVSQQPMIRTDLMQRVTDSYKNPNNCYRVYKWQDVWESLGFLVQERVLKEVPARPWQSFYSTEYVIYKRGQEQKVARMLFSDFPNDTAWVGEYDLVLKRRLKKEVYLRLRELIVAKCEKNREN